MKRKPNLIDVLISFSGTFEYELFVELLLRYWGHPLASDSDYRNQVMELAVEALLASKAGQILIDTVPPKQMNLVAAVWYVENASIENSAPSLSASDLAKIVWLEKLRKALPSCFCEQSMLE
jgi:hypothetical protein